MKFMTSVVVSKEIGLVNITYVAHQLGASGKYVMVSRTYRLPQNIRLDLKLDLLENLSIPLKRQVQKIMWSGSASHFLW